MKFFTKDARATLPYPYYYLPVFLLALAGIGNTFYLALSHFRNYNDIGYASFCAISKAINCDTVSQSPWSIFFNVPVALWGVLGYFFMLIFLVSVRRNSDENRPMWGVLFCLALLYVVVSIFLAYISATKIHAYCLLCLVSYVINFGILFYIWIIRRRFCENSLLLDIKKSIVFVRRKKLLQFSLFVLFSLSFCLKIFIPSYWEYQFSDQTAVLENGFTSNGHPWIGATHPTITIEEFTDYQCFQCAKMHQFLRQLVADNPEKIRLVHRNYPMDNNFNKLLVPEPFHIGSGILALAAIAAEKQNKFWAMNDALYAIVRKKQDKIDLKSLADENSINPELLLTEMYDQKSLKKLEDDIRQGLKYEIKGTPSFVIDGRVYEGAIPADILKKVLR